MSERFKPEQIKPIEEGGKFSVERKFSVMHYEPDWPPYDQREQGVEPKDKSRYMSDLLNKKIIKDLREEITNKMFSSLEEIKEFIAQFVSQRVTESDFGEMAKINPTITEREGRGKKFVEITVRWLDPNKDKTENQDPDNSWKTSHINDPWFSVRVVTKQ